MALKDVRYRLSPSWKRKQTARITFHVYSIWLFTFSDLKTIIIPSTLFATVNRPASPLLGIKEEAPGWPRTAVYPICLAALWAWINLLPFAIDNQRQPSAIEEDRLNKPWRTMPLGRLTQRQAKGLVLLLYPVAVLVSFFVGGLDQCIALILLGVWYNDLGGADMSCLARNLINACGFLCYTSGALQVALQLRILDAVLLRKWLTVIGLIVFSTVQSQDIPDQAGDSARGRKTVPLVLGDELGRWSVAAPVMFWSLFCPWFWNMGIIGYTVPCALGFTIAGRTLLKRSVRDDKRTFIVWNVWLTWLYTLPSQAMALRA